MLEINRNFINGAFVATANTESRDMINPATEAVFGRVSFSGVEDVDAAVAAAKSALPGWSKTTKEERLGLLKRIGEEFKARMPDLIEAVIQELGAPRKLCEALQVPAGLMQIMKWSQLLADFEFNEKRGENEVVLQPIGVCALITSWNWPINSISGVLLPALAAGCTVVWKPSELGVASATILLEVLEKAGVPAGVVNMVIGDGRTVGNRLVTHRDVAMVSFTGSGETGSLIAGAVAPHTKRLVQELGGKSPFIILEGGEFEAGVKDCAMQMVRNSGQTCTSPSRLLVPAERMSEAAAIASAVFNGAKIGDPALPDTDMGPIGNEAQWNKVNDIIRECMDKGHELAAGGPGRPEGMNKGYFVRPTLFINVDNGSELAQEEVFGPVLAIIGYENEADAVTKANDTRYGLSAYVYGPEDRAREVALQLDAGMVHVNNGMLDLMLPFGGVKQSGNGRKLGKEGLLEYLEPKSLFLTNPMQKQ